VAGALFTGFGLGKMFLFVGGLSGRSAAGADGTCQLRFSVAQGGALYSFTIDPAPNEASAEGR
jgi:hypothetical protein